MDVVIIGTGNTATVLGKKLKQAGHQIVQIYGRDAKAASELAYELESESTNYWSVVNRDADIYILAVSDIAIAEIVAELRLSDKVLVHTAAAVAKKILKSSSSHYGVLYPLQSLKSQSLALPDIPIIIDASDEKTLDMLKHFAETISENVVEANDDERLKLHLAAVFCNNFTNHLYHLVEGYCRQENLDFNLLLPLIKETAQRLDELSPADAQTGPAVRRDTGTIEKHMHILKNYPGLREFYSLFTKSIQGL